MSGLAAVLHRLRDRVLLAIAALERGDELGAADEIEGAVAEARARIRELAA